MKLIIYFNFKVQKSVEIGRVESNRNVDCRWSNVTSKLCFQILRDPFQSDDAVNSERMYDLIAVVVHCGSGPNRGHYISIVKSHGFWLLFDDDIVDVSTF